MFSLIITLISIALVAALALATLYYGGTSFNSGNTTAKAATVVNQGQQLMGAMELFHVKEGRWPSSLDELVTKEYLGALPVPVALAPAPLPTALAEDIVWQLPTPGVPLVQVSLPVSEQLCREVNKKARGDNGILKQARTTLSTQCYGADLESLTVVVSKDGAAVSDALAPAEVSAAAVPSDTESSEWLAAPQAGDTQVGGGEGGGSPPATPVQFAITLAGAPVSNLSLVVTEPPNSDYRVMQLTNTSDSPITVTLSGGVVENMLNSYLSGSCTNLAPGSACDLTAYLYGQTGADATSNLTLSDGTGSVVFPVHYVVNAPPPPVPETMKVQLQMEWDGDIVTTMTVVGAGSLSQLNEGPGDTSVHIWGPYGYRDLYDYSPVFSGTSTSFRLLAGSYYDSMATLLPAGTEFTLRSERPYYEGLDGRDDNFEISLTANGTNSGTWCVTLTRDGSFRSLWTGTSTQGACP